jgi:hypothetical protein
MDPDASTKWLQKTLEIVNPEVEVDGRLNTSNRAQFNKLFYGLIYSWDRMHITSFSLYLSNEANILDCCTAQGWKGLLRTNSLLACTVKTLQICNVKTP